MSTPLQPIWLIDPIEPPTEPVLVVHEPLTELIPVQLPRYMGTGQVLPAARPVPQSRPRRHRNIIAVILMLGLLLGGVTAVISAFLDGATERTSTSSSR
jgi:hypothetical protein